VLNVKIFKLFQWHKIVERALNLIMAKIKLF